MKFVAILSVALALASAQTCMTFVCDPSGHTWPDSVCGMPDGTKANQYDIRTGYCSSDESCPYLSLTSSVCTKPTAPTGYGYPGEKCSDSLPCLNGVKCTDSKCVGLASGTACTHVYDCDVSMTCPSFGTNSGKCTTLAAAGAACYQDTDCVQSAGCAGANLLANPPTEGTCVRFASIGAQAAAAADCTAPGTTLVASAFCASGYCFNNGKAAVCSDVLKSAATLPVACTTAGTACTSAEDSVAKTTTTVGCTCGWDGNQYCGEFPGDPEMSTYLADLQTFYSSSHMSECSTARRPPDYMNDWCWNTMYNPSDKEKYSFYKATLYPQIIKASECVIKFMNKDITSSESSSWLLLGGIFIALLN